MKLLKQLAPYLSLVIITGGVYFLTLSRSVNYGDSAEYITVAKTLGIAHPPGYPLYAIFSHLFTLLPFPNTAFKVNLFSAITSVTTICVVYSLIYLLTKNKLVALATSFSLSFISPFWLYSLVAEVYSLNNLLLALLLFSIVLLLKNPQRNNYYYFFSFILAVTLTAHYTIIFFFPSLLLLAYFLRKELSKSVLLISLVFFCLGLLPLIYLPIRAQTNPAANWGKPDTFERFFNVVTRKDYGTFTLTTGSQGLNIDGFLTIYGDFIKNTWGLWTTTGIIGLIWGFRHQKRMTSILLLGFIFIGPLFILLTGNTGLSVFSRASLESFSLPPIVIWSIFIGFGLLAITQFFQSRGKLLSLIIFALPLIALIQNYPKVDQHENVIYLKYGNEIFERLPKNAVVLTFTDRISMISKYLQIVENKRPDVAFISFTFLTDDWYVEELKSKYPKLLFPYEKYLNQKLTEVEAAKIICEDVANIYPVFIERKSAGFNEGATPNCSYTPFGLMDKVNNPKSQISEKDLQTDIVYFKEKQLFFEKQHFYDSYTRSIPYYYAESATNLGKYFEGRKEIEQAQEMYQIAGFVSSDYPESFYRTALSQREKGNIDASIELYKQAVAADPSYYPALKELGILYSKYKNANRTALEYFTRYMVFAPDSKEKTEILKLIKTLNKSSL